MSSEVGSEWNLDAAVVIAISGNPWEMAYIGVCIVDKKLELLW